MSDFDQFSELIGQIYDAALDPSLWPPVLENLCGYLPAAQGHIFNQDIVDKSANSVFSWGMDPVYFESYLKTYAKINPLFPATFFQEVGRVSSALDVMPRAQFERSRFFREWISPQGVLDNVGVLLEKSSTSCSLLTFPLSTAQSPATDGARARLQLLVPHVQRAVFIGKVFSSQKAAMADFAATVDAFATAVYLVDAQGCIAHANRRGHALLAADDLFYGASGRLRAHDPATDQSLCEVFAASVKGDDRAGGKRGAPLYMPSRFGEHYVAYLLPLTSGARREIATTHRAAAALFVRKAADNLSSPPEVLARAYALTQRETSVLFAACEVGAPADVAELLGVSASTVRTHLRSVFLKTNVTRQADLVKLVASFMSPVG